MTEGAKLSSLGWNDQEYFHDGWLTILVRRPELPKIEDVEYKFGIRES